MTLVCAQEDEVSSIREPNVCMYDISLATPSACSPQDLHDAEEEVVKWMKILVR